MDELQLAMKNLGAVKLPPISEDAEYLLSLLPSRVDRKVTQEFLAGKLGDKKTSRVRRLMRELRRAGYAVCSDTKGCWQTTKRHEVNKTIHHLRGRAQSLLRTAAAMEKRMRRSA